MVSATCWSGNGRFIPHFNSCRSWRLSWRSLATDSLKLLVMSTKSTKFETGAFFRFQYVFKSKPERFPASCHNDSCQREDHIEHFNLRPRFKMHFFPSIIGILSTRLKIGNWPPKSRGKCICSGQCPSSSICLNVQSFNDAGRHIYTWHVVGTT